MSRKEDEMRVGFLSLENIVIGLAFLVVIQSVLRMTYPSSSGLFSVVAVTTFLGISLVAALQSWSKKSEHVESP